MKSTWVYIETDLHVPGKAAGTAYDLCSATIGDRFCEVVAFLDLIFGFFGFLTAFCLGGYIPCRTFLHITVWGDRGLDISNRQQTEPVRFHCCRIAACCNYVMTIKLAATSPWRLQLHAASMRRICPECLLCGGGGLSRHVSTFVSEDITRAALVVQTQRRGFLRASSANRAAAQRSAPRPKSPTQFANRAG